MVPRFPPIPGFFRATDNGGQDPEQLGSTTLVWLDRLAVILSAQMDLYPQHVTFVLLDETGIELFRVEARDGEPVRVESAELANQAAENFYQEASVLDEDEIFTAPMRLARNNGVVATPHQPLVWMSRPVFDPMGQRRGVFATALDGETLLSPVASPSMYAGVVPGAQRPLLLDRH